MIKVIRKMILLTLLSATSARVFGQGNTARPVSEQVIRLGRVKPDSTVQGLLSLWNGLPGKSEVGQWMEKAGQRSERAQFQITLPLRTTYPYLINLGLTMWVLVANLLCSYNYCSKLKFADGQNAQWVRQLVAISWKQTRARPHWADRRQAVGTEVHQILPQGLR